MAGSIPMQHVISFVVDSRKTWKGRMERSKKCRHRKWYERRLFLALGW